MIDAILADFVTALHFAFILFVVFGGIAVIRWPWIALLHLPAACWGILIELMNWTCPLTKLETNYRQAAGLSGYSDGFIEQYLLPVIYPSGLTRTVQFTLAAGVLIMNACVYALIVHRYRSR